MQYRDRTQSGPNIADENADRFGITEIAGKRFGVHTGFGQPRFSGVQALGVAGHNRHRTARTSPSPRHRVGDPWPVTAYQKRLSNA